MIINLVVLAVVHATVFSHASAACPRGMYQTEKDCALCPPGTFQDYSTPPFQCTPCPAGTFTPLYGVGTSLMCWSCPPNTYSEQNASSCKPCPKGLVSGQHSTFCTVCALGTYPVSRPGGRVKCLECQPGTYRQNKNDAECKPCPDDLASPRGAKSVLQCRKCPAGSEKSNTNNSGCTGCFYGRFKATGTTDYCENCPLGYIASFRGAKRCFPCAAGTRSNIYGTKCKECPEGYTTYSKGQSVCRKIGSKCPSYTVETPSGDCVRCRLGFFLSEDLKCTPCPPKSRSLGGKARSCNKCPGRQIVETQGSCRCPAGEYFSKPGVCSKCAPGTYLDENTIVVGKPSCVECSQNVIARNWGSKSCTQCPEGQVANANATKCVKCPPGLTVSTLYQGGLECVNITTGYPPER